MDLDVIKGPRHSLSLGAHGSYIRRWFGVLRFLNTICNKTYTNNQSNNSLETASHELKSDLLSSSAIMISFLVFSYINL